MSNRESQTVEERVVAPLKAMYKDSRALEVSRAMGDAGRAARERNLAEAVGLPADAEDDDSDA
jgi:hypothetical protein